MAAPRKRKHASAADLPPSKQARLDRPQATLKLFGGITKTVAVEARRAKELDVSEKYRDAPSVGVQAPKVNTATKRKRGSKEEDAEAVSGTGGDGAREDNTDERIVTTPKSKRTKNTIPMSPAGTPSKATMALFEKLDLDSRPSNVRIARNLFGNASSTQTVKDHSQSNTACILPPELVELCRLYAAVLSALAIYHAHNRSSSPATMNALLSMITKCWRKRTVTLEDVQRVLGFDNDGSLQLEDFGRAGVCLSWRQPRGRSADRATNHVDEPGLNTEFENNLSRAWRRYKQTVEKENMDVVAFIAGLPLAPITQNTAVEQAAPLFARGQQRLADLKAGQAAASKANASTTSPGIEAEHKTAEAVQSRGSNLLDRILAKQALTASMPSGPTKEQLERKAALQRIGDISRVLDSLVAAKPKASLSMPAMVQQLQQSLRNPISRVEVERCLGLMAEEITPGFVSVVESGAVKGVVVNKAGRAVLGEMKARLEAAGA